MRETSDWLRAGCCAALALIGLAGSAARAEGEAGAGTAPALPNQGETEEAPRFDVWEYRIEGNTRLDSKIIEKTVYPFLGPGKSIGDVEQARAALEKAYQNAGFSAAMVDIPEQDVNEGIVFLKVGEGRIDRLRISGSRYFSLGRIKEKAPALAEGKPLQVAEVQEQLGKLAGESPDRTITPVMRAGRTPGTVEVDLQVEDRLPLHGGVEMNLRNSANTTRPRVIGQLRYDNLWQSFHSASLQYQIAAEDPDNLEVWAGTYVMPVDVIESRLAFYGIGLSSVSDVTTAGALNVVGTGHIFGARLVKPLQPFAGLKGYTHTATLGWDYKDFGQSLVLLGADSQNTPIAYSPFMVAYGGSMGYGDGSLTQFNLEADFSIQGLGNDPAEFERKRFKAKANYLYLAGDLKHRQVLPADLLLQARMAWQVATAPLISNEQFGAGGATSVRGYHETERLGDDGVVGSLELYSPDLGPYGFEGLDSLRFLVFGDAGKLWLRSPLPGQPTGYDLASLGAGLRLQILKRVLGEFDWAYPLVAGDSAGGIQAGDTRIDFRLAYEF
jgi:hemolysin activation/secretion protein